MKYSKLLLVVDYQVDFVEGALGFPSAKKLEDGIIAKIKEYEDNEQDIIFTIDTHYDDYLNTNEGINLPIKHCLDNSIGQQIYGRVKQYSLRHLNIKKETFGAKELLKILENKKISNN